MSFSPPPNASNERMLGFLGARTSAATAVGNILVDPRNLEATLSKYCKQVLVQIADPQYPYLLLGSTTCLKINGRHFVLCCGHQIKDQTSENILMVHDHSNSTLSCSTFSKPIIDSNNTDTDWIDTRVLEYRVENYRVANLSHEFFPVQEGRIWPQFEAGHFVVFGYPSEWQEAPYPATHIRARQVNVGAKYDGKSNSPYLHRLRMDRKQIFNADGMSGGSVFYVANTRGEYSIGFAGMVMRGSATSEILYFLEAQLLIKLCLAN